jgi:acyl-CoA thioester hydrolase
MPLIHEKPITISEAHLDSFGHLNHARYFELFEQARWDIITERGFGIETINRAKAGPVILEVNVRFMRELAPREAVIIRSELISYERKIGKFRQQIVKADGGVACEAFFSFGLFDLERRKLIDPSPEWAHAVGIDATTD